MDDLKLNNMKYQAEAIQILQDIEKKDTPINDLISELLEFSETGVTLCDLRQLMSCIQEELDFMPEIEDKEDYNICEL